MHAAAHTRAECLVRSILSARSVQRRSGARKNLRDHSIGGARVTRRTYSGPLLSLDSVDKELLRPPKRRRLTIGKQALRGMSRSVWLQVVSDCAGGVINAETEEDRFERLKAAIGSDTSMRVLDKAILQPCMTELQMLVKELNKESEIDPSLAVELDSLQACVNGVLEKIHEQESGSRILFAGPNGAGKSWILNVLCLLTCMPNSSYKFKYDAQKGWKPGQEARAYIEDFLARDERNGYSYERKEPPSASTLPASSRRERSEPSTSSTRPVSHSDSPATSTQPDVVEEILSQNDEAAKELEFADEIGNLCEFRPIDENVRPYLLPSRDDGVATTPCCVTIRGGPFSCVLFYKDEQKIKGEAFEWVLKNRELTARELRAQETQLRIFQERWEQAVPNEWKNWTREELATISRPEDISLRDEVQRVSGKVFVFAGNGANLDNDRKYVRDMLERSLRNKDTVAFLKHCVAFAPSTMLEGGACVTDSPGMDDADPFKVKALHDGFASHEAVIIVLNRSLKEAEHVVKFLAKKKEFFQNMLPEKRQKNVLAFLHYREKHNNLPLNQQLSSKRVDHDSLAQNHAQMEQQTRKEIDLLIRQAMPSLGEEARQQMCRDRIVVLTAYPTLYASLSFNMGRHRSINDEFAASEDAEIKKRTVQDVERGTKGNDLIGLIVCVSQNLLRLALNDLQTKLKDGRLSALATPKHEANMELLDAANKYNKFFGNIEGKKLHIEAYAKQRDDVFEKYYADMGQSVAAFREKQQQLVVEQGESTQKSLRDGEDGWPVWTEHDIDLVFHPDLGGQHRDVFFRPMLFREFRSEPLDFQQFIDDVRAMNTEFRSKLEELVKTTLKLVVAPVSSTGSEVLHGTIDGFIEAHVKPKMKRLDGFLTLGKSDSHINIENLIGMVTNEVENRATKTALDTLKKEKNVKGSSLGDIDEETHQARADRWVSFLIDQLFGREDEPNLESIYLDEWQATLEDLVEEQLTKLRRIVQAQNWPLANAFMKPFSTFLIARSNAKENKAVARAFEGHKKKIELVLKKHFLDNRQYQDIVASHCGSSARSLEDGMREEGERCVRELYDIAVQRLMDQRYGYDVPRHKCVPSQCALRDVKKVFRSTRTDGLNMESKLEYNFADRIKLRPSATLPEDLRSRLKENSMDSSNLFYALGHQVFGEAKVNEDGFVYQLRYQNTWPKS
jgi:hypothetical protein